MSTKWCMVVVVGLVSLGALGCNSMSKEECMKVRADAFEIINAAHKCSSDVDCVGTDWPGCTKAVSDSNGSEIKKLKDKFTKAKCEEPPAQECRETPEIYCKQGLCVFRERSGE